VVEAAARKGAALPMKLFTLFASEARASAHVARAEKRIARALAKVAGADEWGVRVTFDPRRAAKHAAAGARAATRGLGAGASFLVKKQRMQVAETDALAGAHDAAESLFDEVASVARDAKKKPIAQGPVGTRVVLDAVALVPKSAVRRLEAAVKKASARLGAAGLEVVVSGPWPPYHFVTGP
jgi:hypothetical protein